MARSSPTETGLVIPSCSVPRPSTTSGVSLSRRPRTRTRARTLTGGRPENFRIDVDHDDDNAPESVLVDSPAGDATAITPTQFAFNETSPPTRPSRSPKRASTNAIPGMETVLSTPLEGGQPEAKAASAAANDNQITNNSSIVAEMSTVAHGEGLDAPPIEDVSIVPSRPHARDSVLTQNSTTTTSSSVFPPTTPTTSSPRSPTSPISIMPIETVAAAAANNAEFDGDDVSYRLQLLVKNNYFLPPAHQKPSPSDFAPSSLRARKPTPTFLDLFRVGKTRSKPPSPDSSTECLAPVLRTTSDSTTASVHVQRSPLTPARSAPLPGLKDPSPRVVVVRERLADLASAAKQAEQDTKVRRERDKGQRAGSQSSMMGLQGQLDMIDPTEIVDLPPPSAGYPFAMQTSALHGLTVKESVGAADLAEHLPPPSPDLSSLEAEEIAWRRALLQAAVDLSLHSPSSSFSSSSKGSISKSTPMPSTSPSTESPTMKQILGQKIMQHMTLEPVEVDQLQQSLRNSSATLRPVASSSILSGRIGHGASTYDNPNAPRPSTEFPKRAESPSNIHPLAPPPRKASNPAINIHQRPSHSEEFSNPRKSSSSARVSDGHHAERPPMVMTPPPARQVNATFPQSFHSESGISSVDSHRWVDSIATTSSCYSEVDTGQPRPSMSLSVDRPSLSEYSQPSPKGSAFGDVYHDHYQQSRSSHERSPSSSRAAATSPQPRISTMSPPPRSSSASAPMALTPPPRSSSLRHHPAAQISPPPIPNADPAHDWHPPSESALQTVQISEPTTPASIAERRRGLTPPLIQIRAGEIPVSVHSAPPPSSPISFFDQIESNAVDDIDSSDDSDDEEEEEGYQTANQEVSRIPSLDIHVPIVPAEHTPTQSHVAVPDPTPPFMRFGNHSTPHVGRSPVEFHFEREPTVPARRVLTRKKVSRSDHGHHGPISSAAFKHLIEPTELEPGRLSVSTENNVVALSHKEKDLELVKLDGMLKQHMEREKATLRRIATNTKKAEI